MSEEDIELDYNDLIQDAQKRAYRFLMCDVLKLIQELGDAPGEHHFFIEFMTEAPGVSIPDHLKEQYPERMTIVLQHQFENLNVTDDGMSVTLWFKGKEAQLEIPFDAVTQFADPSAQFGVNFDVSVDDERAEPEEESPATPEEKTEGDDTKSEGADIVSLDSFRKK